MKAEDGESFEIFLLLFIPDTALTEGTEEEAEEGAKEEREGRNEVNSLMVFTICARKIARIGLQGEGEGEVEAESEGALRVVAAGAEKRARR